MTLSQLEHLKKIDAHLERLLAQAEKRTPERWRNTDTGAANVIAFPDQPNRDRPEFDGVVYIHTKNRRHDATFIASCAGNAEAGWKATRVVIAVILSLSTHEEPATIDLINGILSSFPSSLFKL
jgi:hypothetical protein